MRKDRTGSHKRVLIVGCGYVGSALGIRLAGQGDVVFGLRRNVRALPAIVNPHEADLLVPNTLRHLPDVDYVVYLAPGGELLRYFLGAMAALRLRPKLTIVASDVAIYGDRDGEWVDEDSAIEPTTDAQRDLLASERLVAEQKLRATVVRIGEVYGPDRLGLLDDALKNRPLDPAELGRHANLIHRDDCAGAIAHLLDVRRPEPAYVLVDRDPTEVEGVRRWLAAQLDRPEPAYAAEARSVAAPDARPHVRAMSERLAASYRFRYPSFREGYQTLLSRVR